MHKKTLFYLGIISIVVLTTGVVSSRFGYAEQPENSPYATQLDSPIRGLSAQEVDDLLKGRGAGYARMAELNSYPGPRHILDLQQKLSLSPNQVRQIEAVFKQMQADAKRLGQKIVEREQQLSTTFASGEINDAKMQAQTEELGKLYSQLRATHLQAHLQIKPLLEPEQIANYNKLRGYTSTPERSMPTQHQQHSH
jgi:Spy/CpxP family protein refolding chaperone